MRARTCATCGGMGNPPVDWRRQINRARNADRSSICPPCRWNLVAARPPRMGRLAKERSCALLGLYCARDGVALGLVARVERRATGLVYVIRQCEKLSSRAVD